MDERLWICLWMVSGGCLGAVLGGAFGALTAVLFAQNGGAAGTRLARHIVENVLDSAEQQPSSTGRAAIIGAADGIFFLGLLGLVAGALLGLSGRAVNELLLPVVGGSVLLFGGAAFFGTLAYSLSRTGLWAILWIVGGGMLGTLLAGFLLGADNCLLGTIPGLLAALIFSLIGGRYAPIFRSPRVGKSIPRYRLDTETDIMGPPHVRPGSDAIRKPETDEFP